MRLGRVGDEIRLAMSACPLHVRTVVAPAEKGPQPMFDFMRGLSPRIPSVAIRHALEQDGLLPAMDAPPALSVVQSRGRYAGRTVRYFRVFDPARASDRGLTIRAYRDLSAHPDLVLRTGRIEEDGSVMLDHRVPSMDAAIPVREPADRSAHADNERFIFPETFRAEAAKAGRS